MVGDKIKEVRIKKGLNMKQAAKGLGIAYTTYVSYEKNYREPNSEVLATLANFYGCSVDYLVGTSQHIEPQGSSNLLGIKNIIPMPQMKKVPLLGTIACGEPILAQENIEDYVKMPESVKADFALRCKGDSMINARIFDGDIVYVREQPEVENGEIAAVLIDNEATLKRVYYYPEKSMLILKPENTAYQDFIYTDDELNNIKILGKAIAFLSQVK